MTQTQLAKRMGVKPQLISRIEKGEQNITIEALVKLLHALKVVAKLNFNEAEKSDNEQLKIA